MLGRLILALALIEHSLILGGAEGWSLLDILLPFVGAIYVAKTTMQHRLTFLLRSSSILPLLFLILTIFHLLTDPRLEKILSDVFSYPSRLPIGGFRIYYNVLINIMLYYLCPVVITDLLKLQKLLKIFLIVIVAQIVFPFVRILLGIDYLPWDSRTSALLQLTDAEGSGFRSILLGNMGFLLFCYSIALLKPGTILRKVLIIIALTATIVSGGRINLLAIVFVGGLYFFFEKKKRFVPIGLYVTTLVVLITFALIPSISGNLPPVIKKHVSIFSATDNPDFDVTEYTRASMWQAELYIIARHPLWGSFDDFPENMNEESADDLMRGGGHSVYLGIASFFGLPMLIMWILFAARRTSRIYSLWLELTQFKELRSICLWLFLSILGYLFMNVAISGAEGVHRPSYLIFGLIDTVYILASHQVKQNITIGRISTLS